MGDIVIDHHQPLALGGTSERENLVAVCKRCNAWKGNKSPECAESFINEKLEAEWAQQ